MYRRKTRPNIPQQQSAAQTAPLPAPSARWSALAKAVHIGINSRDLRKEFARSGDPYKFFTCPQSQIMLLPRAPAGAAPDLLKDQQQRLRKESQQGS